MKACEALVVIDAYLSREPALLVEHEAERLQTTMRVLWDLDPQSLLRLALALRIDLGGISDSVRVCARLRAWLGQERWRRLNPMPLRKEG